MFGGGESGGNIRGEEEDDLSLLNNTG